MSYDLKSLRKNSNIGKLKDAIDQNKKKSYSDERFWQPTVDKAGNGYAIIRFLPEPFADGESALPWVQLFTHAFEGSGGWLIENCPSTIGKDHCPICAENGRLWKTEQKVNQDIVRERKRKLSYISNIMVISDPDNPANEGQVKLFSYGKKIFDKIQAKLEPAATKYETVEPVHVFDLWEGANFVLRIKKVDGYRNYDDSSFESVSPIGKNDEEREQIWKTEFALKPFVADELFKDEETLQGRFDKVLVGKNVPAKASTAETIANSEKVKEPAKVVTAPQVIEDKSPLPWDGEKMVDPAPAQTADDLMAMFNKLANDE